MIYMTYNQIEALSSMAEEHGDIVILEASEEKGAAIRVIPASLVGDPDPARWIDPNPGEQPAVEPQ